MDDFIPGQRWISNTELQLGLGIVTAADFRTVTIAFPASEEVRTYAHQSAHLTRVQFVPGDEIRSGDGIEMTIESVIEEDNLLIYAGILDDGSFKVLEETRLDHFLQLNRPIDRLFSGQLDHPKWFRLRSETLGHYNAPGKFDLPGLTGGRTALIPHQLYVANEVASRYAPRVLLADEVGLGKTIEAGMIIHSQLLAERAQRVLIVVPESLLHQWLIEMLRRFNLHFSIFNEERFNSLTESDPDLNPFDSEQLILCPLSFLANSEERLSQALATKWDLMVADEAHHLVWTEQHSSPEYSCIEQLAAITQGILLLTATPEQLGKEGHFARLRLLDPQRFPSLDGFIAEEQSYKPFATTIEELLQGNKLSASSRKTLESTLSEGDNEVLLQQLDAASEPDKSKQARETLIQHLLDRHGTGRVLFRNTRATVKGFPERHVHTEMLPLPEPYQHTLKLIQNATITNHQQLLSLELLYQNRPEYSEGFDQVWHQFDPRVEWLLNKLKEIAPQKVLLITADAETAMDLFEVLRVKSGIHAAVFHEQMTLVERDRAAAYFSDTEEGTQVLLCSEIGSEGRNFQFAHHLILFDLPLNPDLLEQRIGRLDRIGQNHDIQIHVPYIESSPQQVMLQWYLDGLDAFTQPCPAGHTVFTEVKDDLLNALHQTDTGIDNLPTLVDATKTLHQAANKKLKQGRDRLLEYNSCRPAVANELLDQATNNDSNSVLLEYLDKVFDCFGVDSEEDGENSIIIHPGSHMQTDSFPGLPEEGMKATSDRTTALANEDMQFLSWAHPLVTGAMDLVLTGELGNTVFTAIKHPGLPQGTLLAECLFVLETATPAANRYLTASTTRLLVDKRGNNYAAKLSPELIEKLHEKVKFETARKIIKACNDDLRLIIKQAEALAATQTPALIEAALQLVDLDLGQEIERLQALQQINRNIRSEEIDFYTSQHEMITATLKSTTSRLDAIQIIVAA